MINWPAKKLHRLETAPLIDADGTLMNLLN